MTTKNHEDSKNRKYEWINNWIKSNCLERGTVKTCYKALKAYDEYMDGKK